MVFIDGAGGTAVFPGFTATATAVTETMDAVPVSPVDTARVSVLNPTLVATISNTVPPSSVTWQVATDTGFGSIVWQTTQTSVNDGVRSALVATALTNATTYYWRVRTGDAAGTTWGAWSATQKLTVDLNAGRGYLDIYENVGREDTGPQRGTMDVYENVGIEDRTILYGVDFMFANVGVPVPANVPGVEYMYLGDVSNHTPTPHLWFLEPQSGRPGDGITIVCFGVGDLQSTYGGVVEANYGGTVGWQAVPAVTWQTFPPTANAYTAARTIDPENGVIDMQHSVVAIVVPAGLLPPGIPLRIRTEGP